MSISGVFDCAPTVAGSGESSNRSRPSPSIFLKDPIWIRSFKSYYQSIQIKINIPVLPVGRHVFSRSIEVRENAHTYHDV